MDSPMQEQKTVVVKTNDATKPVVSLKVIIYILILCFIVGVSGLIWSITGLYSSSNSSNQDEEAVVVEEINN